MNPTSCGRRSRRRPFTMLRRLIAVVLLCCAVATTAAVSISCPQACGGTCDPATTVSPPPELNTAFLLSQSRNIREFEFNHSAPEYSNPSGLPSCPLLSWAKTFRGVRVTTIALASRALLSRNDQWTARSLLRSIQTTSTNEYGTINGSSICALQALGYKYNHATLATMGLGECFHFDWVSSDATVPPPAGANGSNTPFPPGTPRLGNTIQVGLSALALDGVRQTGSSTSATILEAFMYVLELMQVENLFAESPQKLQSSAAIRRSALRSPVHPSTHEPVVGRDDPTFHPLPPVRTLSMSMSRSVSISETNNTVNDTTTTTTAAPTTTTAPTTTSAPTTTTAPTTTAAPTDTTSEAPVTSTTTTSPSTTTEAPTTEAPNTTTTTTQAPPETMTSSTAMPTATSASTQAPTTVAPEPTTTTVAPATAMPSSEAPSTTMESSTTAGPVNTTTTTTAPVTTASPPTTTAAPATPVPTLAPDYHARMATQLLLHSWVRGFESFVAANPGSLTPTQQSYVDTLTNQTNRSIAQWFCTAPTLSDTGPSPAYIPFSIDLQTFAYNETFDAWTQCAALAAVGTLLDEKCHRFGLSFRILEAVVQVYGVKDGLGQLIGIASSTGGAACMELSSVCLMAAHRLQAAYLPSFLSEIGTIVSGLSNNESVLVQQDCLHQAEVPPDAAAYDRNEPSEDCGGPLLSLRETALRSMALRSVNPFEVTVAIPTRAPPPAPLPEAVSETINFVIGAAVGGTVLVVAGAVVFRRARRTPQAEVLLQPPAENLGFY